MLFRLISANFVLGLYRMNLISLPALCFQNNSSRSRAWPFFHMLIICISHPLLFQPCDMKSHRVIHIEILFKSAAPHLHVKLRIWSQVVCMLIRGRGDSSMGVRFHIAYKWERVLKMFTKGMFHITHTTRPVPYNESDITLQSLAKGCHWNYYIFLHNVNTLTILYPIDFLLSRSVAILLLVIAMCSHFKVWKLTTGLSFLHFGVWSWFKSIRPILPVERKNSIGCDFDGRPQLRHLRSLTFLLLWLVSAYQLSPTLYRKVRFYSTCWSRGKEAQNRLLRAKLSLCRAAGSQQIKPLTLSAVSIIRWPFLFVLCCHFDVLSHNRGATTLWRECQ